jgi:hypothetical protein
LSGPGSIPCSMRMRRSWRCSLWPWLGEGRLESTGGRRGWRGSARSTYREGRETGDGGGTRGKEEGNASVAEGKGRRGSGVVRWL